jgi:hypothetical protein
MRLESRESQYCFSMLGRSDPRVNLSTLLLSSEDILRMSLVEVEGISFPLIDMATTFVAAISPKFFIAIEYCSFPSVELTNSIFPVYGPIHGLNLCFTSILLSLATSA